MGVAEDKTISAGSGVPQSEEDLAPGTQVGEYVVENKLGEGGFGAVYKATHPLIGKTAAIKVLNRALSSDQAMVSRFIAEARAVNQIRHRNIIDIFAFGQLPDGRQYFVAELLEGVPMDKHLEQVKRMDLATALPIFRGIAKALDAAHKAGIVHRDLKPENVFLVPNDEGGFSPKLLDFGIAKLLPNSQAGDSGGQHKTRTGMQMGTPFYMSPEQCRGIGVDHRTDVYAFGVMLHRVLSGSMPFDGESVMDVMMKHITTPPPKLSSYGFPTALDAPLERMLAKEPNDRPNTVMEAIEAVQKASSVIGPDSMKLPPITGAPTQAASGIGHTDLGMSSIGAAPKKSSAPIIVGVLAVAAIGAAIFFATKTPSPSPSPSPSPNPPAAATPTPTPTPTTTPTTTPTPTATTAMVKFDTTPKNAELWDGDKKLGLAPGPLPFTEEREITVKAAGFQPKSVKVAPKDGASISVALTPIAGAAKPKPSGTIHKDLDDPFGK